MTQDEIDGFEKKVVEATDFYFPPDMKGQNFSWYGVYGSKSIEPFHILSQALATGPDHVILKRGTRERVLYIYYTNTLEVTEFIPFGKWKLFAPSPNWGKNSFYFLEDGVGEKQKIDISEHPEQIPKYLKAYIEFNSFKEYELQQQINVLKNKIAQLER